MERFLAEPGVEAPFIAGHGGRRREKAVLGKLDAILTQLEVADQRRAL
jgi:hypothetical protein